MLTDLLIQRGLLTGLLTRGVLTDLLTRPPRVNTQPTRVNKPVNTDFPVLIHLLPGPSFFGRGNRVLTGVDTRINIPPLI